MLKLRVRPLLSREDLSPAPETFGRTHLAALRYMRRSQSLTPGIHTSSSFSVTAWPAGEGKGCRSGSLA